MTQHGFKIKRYFIFGFIFLMYFIYVSLADAAPIGKITAIIGNVDITAPAREPKKAELDSPVNVGDVIRTRDLSRAEIKFMDGNIIHLSASCSIEITEYYVGLGRMSGLIRLLKGKMRNIINRTVGRTFGLQQSNRFEVHTPTAVIGVRGTDFFTYHINGISGSTFKEGEGYCFSLNRPDEPVFITAGQSITVKSPDMAPEVRPADNLEIETLEQETSPKAEDGNSSEQSTERAETISSDRRSQEGKALEKGIDDEIRNMDRPDRGVEILRQVPVPAHDYSHSH